MEGLTSRYRGRAPWEVDLAGARASAGRHQTAAGGRNHALVVSPPRSSPRREQEHRPARLARGRVAAASPGALHRLDRPRLREEGGRHHRAVSGPSGPPRHAAAVCLDEKTAILALDRRDRVLPLSPARVERHGFEYKRHGSLSLYAALNIQIGDVVGKTTARHTSQDFVGFLAEVVVTSEPDQEIHVILDNLSADKTKLVAAFLDEHRNVNLHSTPTYSSWLNQVELWFSKVQRDVLSRGICTSTADLARKLRRYIKAYAKKAKPFCWKYSDPTRRIPHGKLRTAIDIRFSTSSG